MAVTSLTVDTTIQTSDTTVAVAWTADDDAASSWTLYRSVNAGAFTAALVLTVPEARLAAVPIGDLADDDELVVRVEATTEAITADGDTVTLVLPFDPPATERLKLAALLIALRNVKVMDAPLGVAGGYDVGSVYVGRISADVGRLLRGYRGGVVPTDQEWPTLTELKARLQATTTLEDDFLADALAAAIDEVEGQLTGSFGLA